MSLTGRAMAIVVVACVLGIVGEWLVAPGALPLWRVVALALVLALAYEWAEVRSVAIAGAVDGGDRLLLARPSRLDLSFTSDSVRVRRVEYALSPPGNVACEGAVETLALPAKAKVRRSIRVVPCKLGDATWPAVPLRVAGALGLAWWPRRVVIDEPVSVRPDTLSDTERLGSRDTATGASLSGAVGGGRELLMLRDYRPGDARRSIDWKATARRGDLVSRVFDEEQDLEVVIAVDAGRASRTAYDGIDLLGHFANVASRLAEYAVLNEDRVGLVVFAGQTLVSLAPMRGVRSAVGIRRALSGLAARAEESDPVAAMLEVRRLVRHRSLVVVLTDLYGGSTTGLLSDAVELLRPTHVPVVGGVVSREVVELTQAQAARPEDAYRGMAASEYRFDVMTSAAHLRRRGVEAVVARPGDLDRQIRRRYAILRQKRRV